jgi:acyl carrier protein
MQEILDELTLILRDVFDNDNLVATPELTAPMVEGWDSLNNVRLFVAIEQALKLRFTAQEIAGLENVGELAALIRRKRGR